MNARCEGVDDGRPGSFPTVLAFPPSHREVQVQWRLPQTHAVSTIGLDNRMWMRHREIVRILVRTAHKAGGFRIAVFAGKSAPTGTRGFDNRERWPDR